MQTVLSEVWLSKSSAVNGMTFILVSMLMYHDASCESFDLSCYLLCLLSSIVFDSFGSFNVVNILISLIKSTIELYDNDHEDLSLFYRKQYYARWQWQRQQLPSTRNFRTHFVRLCVLLFSSSALKVHKEIWSFVASLKILHEL